MIVESHRFGQLDFPDDEIIEFSQGIIGFNGETQFLLIRHGDSPLIAWLQSAKTAGLALPAVSAHGLAPSYPDVSIVEVADAAGLGNEMEDLAVMAVLCALPGQPATVNLLAPIVVNVATRKGAQLILEGSKFTTRELFLLPTEPGPARAVDKTGGPTLGVDAAE